MARYPGLDLLRAIAISWVLLFHAGSEGLGRPFDAVGRHGWMAVDLFFVLSGYLIAAQLFKNFGRGDDRAAFREFYARRLIRILPPYLTMVGVYFFCANLREAPGLAPWWQFLSFTENLLIDYQHNRAFSHAWSLCVEEHFYLLFPLLAWLLLRRPSVRTTIFLCAFLVGGGVLLRAAVWTHLDAEGLLRTKPWTFIEAIYYPTYMRLDGLLAGVMLAALRHFRPAFWGRVTARGYWLLGVGMIVLALAIWIAAPRTTFVAAVFGFPLLAGSMALIVAASVSPSCVLSRVRIPGAQTIATLTFSIYLSHKLVWHVVKMLAPRMTLQGGIEAFVIFAAAALLGGSLLYFAVERPALLIREYLGKKPRLLVARSELSKAA